MDSITITDITQQKKNKNRYNIFVDGEYFTALPDIVILENGLKSGMEIERAAFEEIVRQGLMEQGFKYAVGYVSKFFQPESVLRRKLIENDYPLDIIDEIIQKLKEYNYVDDYAFCLAYIRTHAQKYGRDKVFYELRTQKGIDEQTADSALDAYADQEALSLDEGFNDVWEQNAFRIALKKTKGQAIQRQEEEKIRRLLYSCGFKSSEISSAIHRLKAAITTGD